MAPQESLHCRPHEEPLANTTGICPLDCAPAPTNDNQRIGRHLKQPEQPPRPSSAMRKSCLNDASSSSASKSKSKKRLRWSTITVHEFGVDVGRSSVSDKGGPSIGLSEKPEFTWSTKVGEMAVCSEGVHRFTPKERFQLLQAAGVSEGIILRFAREANIILHSRKRTLEEERMEQEEKRREKKHARVMHDRACCSSCIRRPPMIPAGFV